MKKKKITCIILSFLIVFSAISLSLTPVFASNSKLQDKYVSTAKADFDKHTKYPSNTCLKWTCDMFDKTFGVKVRRYASAADASKSLKTRKELTKEQKNGNSSGIPKGAVIFWKGGKKLKYGHVGIYDGSGYVYHNYSGTLTKQKYKSFVDKGVKLYGVNWAWLGDINLTKPVSTSINSIKATKTTITVKWDKKTDRVSGYQLQYSTKKDLSSSTTLKFSGTRTTSKTIKELKSNTTYYLRIRTYRIYGNTTDYSSWSKSSSIYTGTTTKKITTTTSTTKKSTTVLSLSNVKNFKCFVDDIKVML